MRTVVHQTATNSVPASSATAGTLSRLQLIDRLSAAVDEALRGRATVVSVVGEPGLGKSTVLDTVTARCDGDVVLRGRGSAGGVSTPFSLLTSILHPIRDRWPDLALDLSPVLGEATSGGSPEHTRLWFAFHRVIAGLAETQRVCIAVDDAADADDESLAALAFAMGRLTVDPVCLMLAHDRRLSDTLEPVVDAEFALAPLGSSTIADLIVASGVSDPSAVQAICDSAGGNPWVADELVRSLPEDGPVTVGPLVPTAMIVRRFRRLIDGQPTHVRRGLVVLAAAGQTDEDTIDRALAALGEPPGRLSTIEGDGLIEQVDDLLALANPAVRMVAYHSVGEVSRRAAHRALATVLDRPTDAPQRVEHLVAAASGPDDEVAEAAALVARAADRAGSHRSAALKFEQAARLSPSEHRRAGHRLDAAASWAAAGESSHAVELLDSPTEQADDDMLARLCDLKGTLQGPQVALEALVHLDFDDRSIAAALSADLILSLRGAADALADLDDVAPVEGRGDRLAAITAQRCGRLSDCDLDESDSSALASIERNRKAVGFVEVGLLESANSIRPNDPYGLVGTMVLRHRGELATAEQALQLMSPSSRVGRVGADLRAQLADVSQLRTGSVPDNTDDSPMVPAATTELWARGRAAFGQGMLDDAVDLLWRAASNVPHLFAGDLAVVLAALDRSSEAGEWIAGLDLDLGPIVEIRARRADAALRRDDVVFDRIFEVAVAHDLVIEAWETRLTQAEARARSGDGRGARVVAQTCSAAFGRLGIRGWLQRCARILDADTGPNVAELLTAAELRVATEVARGGTNKQAAAALYLSVKTIDFHLQNIYRKLEIGSRTELAVLMTTAGGNHD